MKKEIVYTGIIQGAKEVMENQNQLNHINVFPVPDGDTGSNLFSTMNSIVIHSELKHTLKHTLESIADSAITGARGNSGIIFAQYFQGLSEGVKDDELTREVFIEASGSGMRYAYDAVESPVEGTVLTVMKVFHEAIKEFDYEAFEEVLEKAYQRVAQAVEKTTNQLKSLKKAGVVDSGAKGFQYFIKGFIRGIKGQAIEHKTYVVEEVPHHHESEMTHRYCTEALLKNVSVDLKPIINAMGDSLVVAGSDRLKRVHVHTDNPTRVFEVLSSYGHILETKVDDMWLQNNIVNNRKHDRVIVTDSIADIPKELLDEEQVVVLPLSVSIGDEEYLDKLTISNEKILSLFDKKPKSSLPTLPKVKKLYDYLSSYYKEIIVVSVSKELSGTYQVFKKLAREYDHIHVIDSMQNSVSQGLLVKQAIKYLNEGLKTDELLSRLKEDVDRSKILVNIQSIDPMIQSGRLSINMGKIVKKLNVKPVVTLKSGEGSVFTMAFGAKRALKKILNHVKKVHEEVGFKHFAITYVDDEKKAISVRNKIESYGIKVDYIVQSSAIIANGAGRGAVAIGYIKKE